MFCFSFTTIQCAAFCEQWAVVQYYTECQEIKIKNNIFSAVLFRQTATGSTEFLWLIRRALKCRLTRSLYTNRYYFTDVNVTWSCCSAFLINLDCITELDCTIYPKSSEASLSSSFNYTKLCCVYEYINDITKCGDSQVTQNVRFLLLSTNLAR